MGERGHGADEKIPASGIPGHNGKINTKVISDAPGMTLIPIIKSKTTPRWRGYNALKGLKFRCYRINHFRLFASSHHHIKWYQEFLEPGQAENAQIKGCATSTIRAIFNRLAIFRGM